MPTGMAGILCWAFLKSWVNGAIFPSDTIRISSSKPAEGKGAQCAAAPPGSAPGSRPPLGSAAALTDEHPRLLGVDPQVEGVGLARRGPQAAEAEGAAEQRGTAQPPRRGHAPAPPARGPPAPLPLLPPSAAGRPRRGGGSGGEGTGRASGGAAGGRERGAGTVLPLRRGRSALRDCGRPPAPARAEPRAGTVTHARSVTGDPWHRRVAPCRAARPPPCVRPPSRGTPAVRVAPPRSQMGRWSHSCLREETKSVRSRPPGTRGVRVRDGGSIPQAAGGCGAAAAAAGTRDTAQVRP